MPAGRRGCRRSGELREGRSPRRRCPSSRRPSGKADRGTANASSTSSFQSDPSTRRNPLVVADAFVGSVTCSAPPEAPPDSIHAIQLSTVPKQRSRPRGPRCWRAARRPWSPTGSVRATSRARPWPSGNRRPCAGPASRARPDRLARRSIPHQRAGPLIGDADGSRPARRPGRARRAPPRAAWRPCRRRRTRPARGTVSRADRVGTPAHGASTCRRRPRHAVRTCRHRSPERSWRVPTLVEGENPLAWRHRTEQATDEAGDGTRPRLKMAPNQLTRVAAITRMTMNTACADDVGADGGDDRVADRGPASLDPGGTPPPRTKPTTAAKKKQRLAPPPSSESTIAAIREGDGDDEADTPPPARSAHSHR